MAGPKKKRNVQQNATGDTDSDNEEMDIEGTLQADFEGRNPESTDFHGIQQLLRQLFLKAHVNLSELSDLLISQPGIGSVLKQSADEDDVSDDDDDDDDDAAQEDSGSGDVFGITSVINLTQNKEKECVKQLFQTLKDLAQKYADKTIEEQINKVLFDSNRRIGLLINERFINIPAKIADPLMDSLLKEIERISKKNEAYRFDYYVMICKTYKSTKKDDNKDDATDFVNAEEEIFSNASDVSFEFSVANESDTGVGGLWTEDDKQMIPHRKVLVITASKFSNIVHNVKTFVA